MKRSLKIVLSVLILMSFIFTSLGLTSIAVKSIKLNATSVNLTVGKTYGLKVTFTPANATNKKVTFSSANKSIATVSSSGNIKGIKAGKTVITVTSVSNKKAIARCNVTVSQVSKLNPVTTAPKEKIKMKLWHRASGTDPSMGKLLERFKKAHPEVELIYAFFGENYQNVVSLALAAGNPADVFEATGNLTVVGLAKQGHLIPVDDVLSVDFKKNLYPSALKQQDIYFNGKMYTVPIRIDSYRLLYNKDLFKKAGLDPAKPPKTLEEMRTMAKKITEAGKGEYYGFGLPLGVANVWFRILDTVGTAMGEPGPYGFDYKTGKFDFSKNKRILEYYMELQKDKSLFPGYETLAIDPMRANFATGKIAMTIDGSWMSGVYANQIVTTQDWDAAPVPIFEGSKRAKDYAFCGVTFVVSKYTKNQAAAKDLFKMLVENSIESNKLNPQPKVYLPANKPEVIPVKELNVKGFDTMFRIDDLAGFTVEPHKFIAVEGDNRDKVFTNLFAKAASGKVDIDKAIEDLNKLYNSALDKAIADGVLKLEDIKNPNFDYFKR